MIYQCYFEEHQLANIFKGKYYRDFCLNPQHNHLLLETCPELESEAIRKQLCEYAALLFLWRHPLDEHDWLGLTSWRQTDKTSFLLKDDANVNQLLSEVNILSWGYTRVLFQDQDLAPVCAIASENSHPGIMAFLKHMLNQFDCIIPSEYWNREADFFANYWIMSKKDFDAFMEWSWPMIAWGIANIENYTFTQKNEKALGFVAERLFIFWYHLHNKKIKNIGPEIVFNVYHASSPIEKLTKQLKASELELKKIKANT